MSIRMLVLKQVGVWHLLLDLLVVHHDSLDEIKLLRLMYLFESSIHLLLNFLMELHFQLNGVSAIFCYLLELHLSLLFSVQMLHGYSEAAWIA